MRERADIVLPQKAGTAGTEMPPMSVFGGGDNKLFSLGGNHDETGEAVDPYNYTAEELIKELKDGRVRIKRLPQGVDKEVKGVLGQAEAVLDRGDGETDAQILETGFGNDGRAAQRAAEQEKVGAQQEAQLEEFAKENDLWLNDDYEDGTLETALNENYAESAEYGSESQLFHDESRPEIVIKETDLSHYSGNPRTMLDKYAVFNSLFPGTAYKIIGFGHVGV